MIKSTFNNCSVIMVINVIGTGTIIRTNKNQWSTAIRWQKKCYWTHL